jgi:hypothetical protein
MNDVPELPLRISQSIGRRLKLVLLGLVGALCGLLAAINHHPVIGYSCLIFFGLGSLGYAASLASRRNYLEISTEGLTMPVFFRSYFVPWHQVRGFFVVPILDTKLIGWNYSSDFAGHTLLRRLAAFLVGAEGTLSSYGMQADDLVSLLNRVRERYSDLRFPTK